MTNVYIDTYFIGQVLTLLVVAIGLIPISLLLATIDYIRRRPWR